MKRQVMIFVVACALLLLAVPMVNLVAPVSAAQPTADARWWHGASLYRFDRVLSWLARALYPLGISTEPTQAVIGKDGWLYLGDLHNARLSRGRAGATSADTAAAVRIAAANAAWAEWYRAHGVREFRVLFARDKNSIYPQHLPEWARDAPNSVADTLLARASKSNYIDTRAELLKAKGEFSQALYYKTDSHWNALGAWVGFRALINEVSQTDPALKDLTAHPLRVTRVDEYLTGDLSAILRTVPSLHDLDLVTELAGLTPVETQHLDFETGRMLFQGGNPRVGAPARAMLVKSSQALTSRRVLWLRDSYGVAMSPYMAAAFAETLQVHYSAATPQMIAHWVKTFRPDYVFVTVVERDVQVDWFKLMPPR